MSIPTPFPYKGEMLCSALARQMRYLYIQKYHTFAKLVDFPLYTLSRAYSTTMVEYFYKSLDRVIELKRLLLENTLFPLLTLFDHDVILNFINNNGIENLSKMSNNNSSVSLKNTDIDALFERRKYSINSIDLLKDIQFSSNYKRLKKYFCYCPQCFHEQMSLYNERYWLLEWQIPVIKICAIHRCPLISTNFRIYVANKLFDASTIAFDNVSEIVPDPHSDIIADTVHSILTTKEIKWHLSIEWMDFFCSLATSLGYKVYKKFQKRHMYLYKFEGIRESAIKYWGSWLSIYAPNIFLFGEWMRPTGDWLRNFVILKAIDPNATMASAIESMENVTALSGNVWDW